MAGCDYLPSLHGIGLKKAFKFWSKVTQPSLELALPKIPGYLNMKQISVTEEYIRGFVQANLTFLYQIVYDPMERKMRPLTEYEGAIENSTDLSFAGGIISDHVQAFDFAIGNLNISKNRLEKISNFSPDETYQLSKNSYGKRAQHLSIWSNRYSKEKQLTDKQQKDNLKILSCFPPGLKKKENTAVLSEIQRSMVDTESSIHRTANGNNVGEKRKDEENVWFISKYFKTQTDDIEKIKIDDLCKIQSVKEVEGAAAMEIGTHLSNNLDQKCREVEEMDIVNSYENQPKSIIKTPPQNKERTILALEPFKTTNQQSKIDKEKSYELKHNNKENDASTSPTSNTNINNSNRKRKNSDGCNTAGWFGELEEETPVGSRLIYNTQVMDSNYAVESENGRGRLPFLKSKLSKFNLDSSTSSKNGVSSKNTDNLTMASDQVSDISDKVKKRNPFAIVSPEHKSGSKKSIEGTEHNRKDERQISDVDKKIETNPFLTNSSNNGVLSTEIEGLSPIKIHPSQIQR